jgi:hypothetical protein
METPMDEQNTPLNSIPTPPSNRAYRFIKQTFGYLVALVCLIWVFHDIHFRALLQTMTNVHWEWVGIAIVFDILSYISQGIRWRLLLKTKGEISVLKATQAIYAGLFTNEILPLRIGELVRAYLASCWLYSEFVSIIPSMAVERLFDGVWLALAIGLVAIFIPLPKDLIEGEEMLGAVVLIATGVFLYLVFRKKTFLYENSGVKSGWRPLGFVKSLISRLHIELQAIGMSRSFYMSFAVSLFILFFQILAFWLVMRAYDLNLSFWAGAVVFLIVHLGTAIPNAPANIGTYQFFCVVGLSLFGVEKTLATAFSVVVFIILTIPLWVIGMIALSYTSMSLTEIRNEINRLLLKAKTKEQK